MASSPVFPPAARDWLAQGRVGTTLAIGAGSIPTARRMGAESLWVAESTGERAAALAQRWRLPVVCGAPSALPFQSCSFDDVVISDLLHSLPPRLCLAEFARALRPGGRLTVTHTARDDSVPWVRRLARILHSVAPEAMRPDGPAVTAAAVAAGYFQELTHRSFRLWVPVLESALVDMVDRVPAVAQASPGERQSVLAEVANLYRSSARPPEPLLLPYTINCWRGRVDHAELTMPLQFGDEGLHITLEAPAGARTRVEPAQPKGIR